MKISRFLSLGLALGTLLPVVARAQQQRPTPDQAQAVLQARPDLAARLQTLIQGSGLTADQIRSRLSAEGYSSSLLDSYLAGASATPAQAPSEEVIAAVSSLGLSDSAGVADLRSSARARRQSDERIDSLFVDSLVKAIKDDSTRAAIRRFMRSRSAQNAYADSGFTVFGSDLFANETSQFDPNITGAVDAGYRLGPGDKLLVILNGDTEKQYPLEVTREGVVFVPEIGSVVVTNLTLSQFEDVLYTRLGRIYSGLRRGSGATTRMAITVANLGTNQVFVTGDVAHPGSYRVSRAGTALSALYVAGGPTSTGSMRSITIRRGNQPISTLDTYDYILHGDASHDVRLENNDVIFVAPRGDQVRIAGAVVRPATYELAKGETLADLIRMAGGFAPNADLRRVQIERILPPNQRTSSGSDRRAIEVASDLFASETGPREPLVAGDIIHVFTIPMRVSNRVMVKGNVWTPGPVALAPGMHLSDALRRAGGLKPDSYLGEVLITRSLPDSSRQLVRTALRDTTGNAVTDVSLRDGDEISVYSVAAFRPKAYVVISGAVKNPGRMPWHEGMTLRDLVLISGGLQESALLNEAEIARLPENRAAGVTAVTARVPLDSSYLFGRTPDGRYVGPPGIQAATPRAPEVPIAPYDAVLILQQPEWQLQRTVTITGEVRYPGEYALTRRDERLLDLINRAGGLTDRAYANGIEFYRKQNDVGRIGLDLPEVLRNPKDPDNIELADHDAVVIPRFIPVVTMKGAVNSPVAVTYVAGQDIDYYIRAAGGPSVKGDKKAAFVTQPNGKVESRHRRFRLWVTEPKPQPGSTVEVPEKDPNDKMDLATLSTFMTTFASILGSAVAIVAIARH